MMTICRLALLGAIVLASVTTASAEDFTVSQKNHEFEPKDLVISAGDTVTFVNDDTGTHNVYSQSPGNSFDLKAQRPGTSAKITLSTPGRVEIRCAIHPAMRMQIIVK